MNYATNVTNSSSHLPAANSTATQTTYWQYAALQLSSLSMDTPETANLSAMPQETQLLQQESDTPTLLLLQNDNSTQQQQQIELPPASFFNTQNHSEELFFYFNNDGDVTELVQTAVTQLSAIATTTANTVTTNSYNIELSTITANAYNITPEPNLYEFLESLPSDRISLLSFLILFSFATVFGNSLVILAVIRERYLHTATNYFITSLAVADCLVGLVVMPFSALYEVLENTWFFGTDWCDIWRSLDVLFSTASILNLCVISLDRYWAITDPFSYPMRMTVKRAAGLICAVWICSSAISFPAIVWWRAARDGEMPAFKCTFTEHLGYLVFSSTISFYLPLLVMVFTYCRIYRAAVIQTRSLKIGTKQVLMASGELQLTLRIHRGGTTREPTASAQHPPCGHIGGSLGGGGSGIAGSQHHSHSHSHHHHHGHHNHSASGTTTSTPEEPDDEPLSALHNNGLSRHRHMGKNFSLSRKLAKFAKEKKAAKTLGIVMGVFIVCWLPFFVVNLLSGFCMECIEHEEIVSAIVTWLGWINSCMNPVIYACWSRDFRRAFVRLLCVCCPRKIRRKYQPTMRSKSQCHVAAAMVAASTSFGYHTVNQIDRSIMRQLSTCSSCSTSSNCGRSVHQQQQHQQQHQLQPPRSCTRCQSFHRHHHRSRRRSSGTRNDYNGSAVLGAAKTLVTITSPTAAPSMLPTSSGSTLTISSVPPTLKLEPSLRNSRASLSAATTPASAASMKHCTFALTPTTIPIAGNQFGYLAAKQQSNNQHLYGMPAAVATAAATHAPTTAAVSMLMQQATTTNVMPTTKRHEHNQHRQLELRQSIQSQVTTIDDDDDDDDGDDDVDDIAIDNSETDNVEGTRHDYTNAVIM